MVEPTQNTLTQVLSHLTFKDICIALVITLVILFTTRLINNISQSIINKYPRKRMKVLELVPFINFGVYFLGFLGIILIVFQPTKEYFLGFFVSALFALGFVARDIIQSVLAGIMLLIDKPFQVGDRITFNDHSGEIITIGFHSIKLITLDKSIITIPNSRFMSDIVVSNSAGSAGMMTMIALYINAKNNIPKAVSILKITAQHMPEVDTKEYPVTVFVHEVTYNTGSFLKLETRCAIKDARLEREFQSEFLIQANKAFLKENIR